MKNHHTENVDQHHSLRGVDRINSSGARPRMKVGMIVCFCILSLMGNIAGGFLTITLRLPVFLDTIFTVVITFYAGLAPGLIVAALYNPIMTVVECTIHGTEIFYYDFFYALCGMLIALSTWTFSRNKKEFFFNRTVTFLYLLIIVFVSSFLSSFCASALDTFIRPLFEKSSGFSTIDNFSTAFQKFKFGVFLSYLLPRIPITVLDRLICTFSGFGLYRVVERKIPC